MNIESPFSEEEIREIAKEKIKASLGWKIHFTVYCIVNLMIFSLNVVSGLNVIWFVYPMFGWLIGIAVHGTAYYIYSRGITNQAKNGLIIHAVIYFTTILLLFIINYTTDFRYPWFLWAAGFWLIGLMIQAVLVKLTSKAKSESKKSWLEQKVDEEINKIKQSKCSE
ncbi:MAG: 2TM domain-containing protein [Promethearchaeota archaeon]